MSSQQQPWQSVHLDSVHLDYGRDGLDVRLPAGAVVLQPHPTAPLPDPSGAVTRALRRPIGSAPLAKIASAASTTATTAAPVAPAAPGCRVAIVTSDLTRPVPNQLLLEAILAELHVSGIPADAITLINGTGLHRPNSAAELSEMYGPAIAAGYRIVNHDARDRSALATVGTDARGVPLMLNRAYLEADLRIVTGFIEPHLFAGYSGGGKGVMPGIAGRETIMSNHSASMVGHPRATFGETAGNPIFQEIRAAALLAGPAFLVNVTMDAEHRVTGVFAGDLVAAHDAGIAACRAQALVDIAEPFDIIVTTNGGYPADLNLYQAIKGLSVAARGVRPGGHIVLAAACAEGLGGDAFRRLLCEYESPAALLAALTAPGTPTIEDQWQAQLEALALQRGSVWLYSALTADDVMRAHLRPCTDIETTVAILAGEIDRHLGRPPRIGVLPHGQQAVPVVREAAPA